MASKGHEKRLRRVQGLLLRELRDACLSHLETGAMCHACGVTATGIICRPKNFVDLEAARLKVHGTCTWRKSCGG